MLFQNQGADIAKLKKQLAEAQAELAVMVRDITALRLTEMRYQSVFEFAVDGILLGSAEGTVTGANQRMCEILGMSEDTIVGHHIAEFFKPDVLNEKPLRFDLLKAGKILVNERKIVRPDGSTIYIEMHSRMMPDRSYHSIFRDITERQYIEKALRQSEEQFKSIIQSSPMGMHYFELMSDNRLFFTGANPAADTILGVSNKMFVGKTIEAAFPALIGTDIPDKYREICRTASVWTTEQLDYKDNNLNGAFEIVAFGIGHNKMATFFTDITYRKKMEAALRNETERLSVTLRSIGDGVICTDTSGIITLINEVAEHLTGYTASYAAGKQLCEVFKIVNQNTRLACENPVDKVMKTGGIIGLANHTVLIARSGSERVIADSGAPIRNSEGAIIGVVLVFRDITEKERIDHELLNAQKLESVGILAGGIAHDFNNMLGGLFGFIDLARFSLKKNDAVAAGNYLSKSMGAFDRARSLTQQLLTFSKGGAPVKQKVNLVYPIKETVLFALSGASVVPEFVIDADLWSCLVDEHQISQVIDNLVINAVQAMPTGGTITVAAHNVCLPSELPVFLNKGPYIKITVSDHGVGIMPEYLSKIFDPFFTTKQKGSGLGLAAAYSIIKRHDGHIEAASTIGKGTTITVYLPADIHSAEIKTDSPESVLENIRLKKGRVLIMDDEVFIAEVAKKILEHAGHVVTRCQNGQQAVAAVTAAVQSGTKFHCVILDLTIPGGMGGRECIVKIRAVDPDIKAVVSSGYSDDPVMAHPQDYGFDDVLIKPYQHAQIIAVVEKLLPPQ